MGMIIDAILYLPRGAFGPLNRRLTHGWQILRSPTIACHFVSDCARHRPAGGVHPENDTREKIVWYGLIPICLIAGIISLWGICALFDLYFFSTLFFTWGSIGVDVVSNLIVRGRQASEWIFMQDLAKVLTRRTPSDTFYLQCQAMSWLLKRFCAEMFLLHTLGKSAQFLAGLTKNFMGWLLFYTGLKAVVDRSPSCLHRSEPGEKPAREQAAQSTVRSTACIVLKNGSWLLGYKIFQAFGSQAAKKQYEALHQHAGTEKNLTRGLVI